MKRAIQIAKKQKIPISAIIVHKNFEIGVGINCKKFNYTSNSHAEINALKQSSFYGYSRIIKNSTIYTTLQPCVNCLFYISLFKIKKLIFGSFYKKVKIKYNKKYITEAKSNILEKTCNKLINKFNNKLYL